MDKNEIALAILPTVISMMPSSETATEEDRRKAVVAAFDWADTYLEVRREHVSFGTKHMLLGDTES